MSSAAPQARVTLSEILGVLSFGTDLGMGQPMEHVLRQSLIALALARRLELDDRECGAVFYASLVAWVGCHVDAYEQAKWFGDETVLKGDFRRTDFASAMSAPLFMARHLGNGGSVRHRVGLMPGFMAEGRHDAEALLENHWLAADDLMVRFGFEQLVRDTVEQSFERWDGRGAPRGIAGERILMTARLVNFADVVEVYERGGGVDAAVGVARDRAGTQFDPALVSLFAAEAPQIFSELSGTDAWPAMLATPYAAQHWVEGESLDRALEAVADFVDVKSPYAIGHSRGVAALADAAGRSYGLDAAQVDVLRRAALVHDLGKLGIPNTIWDKPGPLTPAERERVRMHAYLTERMLASCEPLAPLAAVAVEHHERLDGSGYPRGLAGADISPPGRILAAADSYHARREPRPHRPAMPADQAAAEVRADVRAGLIDGDAAEAVLQAAGHRAVKRREWPAGLTAREVDVLQLLARGMSNKQIAGALVISPKTAGTHVEHIYDKLGVTNRALASLFAAKHGLIAIGDASP